MVEYEPEPTPNVTIYDHALETYLIEHEADKEFGQLSRNEPPTVVSHQWNIIRRLQGTTARMYNIQNIAIVISSRRRYWLLFGQQTQR